MTPSAVILNTTYSQFAILKPISIGDVHLDDGFWKSRLLLNRSTTLESQYQQLEATGRLDNFRRVSQNINKPFLGYVFNDSDVYKWLEAASWAMVNNPNDTFKHQVDYVISLLASAQDRDGYLNTYFSFEKKIDRWMNLREKHELYCAGHLIQAAIAHFRATGEESLLNIAIRFAVPHKSKVWTKWKFRLTGSS